MSPNATKCTFGHSDVICGKQHKSGKNHDLEITLYLLSLNTGLSLKWGVKYIYFQYLELSALVLANNILNFPISSVKRLPQQPHSYINRQNNFGILPVRIACLSLNNRFWPKFSNFKQMH